jgi:NAD(P)-dependent dehydrogenase (short-subunit alcohol dehydrogenase family)
VIVRADQSCGLAIAKTLASSGVTVVMHSTRGSEAIADALHEIVTGGGQALAVECDLADPAEPESLLSTVSRLIGPVSVIILPAPEVGLDETAGHNPDSLEESFFEPAQEVLRWGRGLVSVLAEPSQGTAIGVQPGRPADDLTAAVRLAAWRGALKGLRTELRQLGAQVHEVIATDPGEATFTRRGARLAAEAIARLVTRGPAPEEGARGGMQETTMQPILEPEQ